MSVSFMWEVAKPTEARSFNAGTSLDESALRETFGDTVSTKDIATLKAMHRATRQEKSLWSEMADTLERLRGEDYDKEVTIRVWTEY
jgi:hypothetical protein